MDGILKIFIFPNIHSQIPHTSSQGFPSWCKIASSYHFPLIYWSSLQFDLILSNMVIANLNDACQVKLFLICSSTGCHPHHGYLCGSTKQLNQDVWQLNPGSKELLARVNSRMRQKWNWFCYPFWYVNLDEGWVAMTMYGWRVARGKGMIAVSNLER